MSRPHYKKQRSRWTIIILGLLGGALVIGLIIFALIWKQSQWQGDDAPANEEVAAAVPEEKPSIEQPQYSNPPANLEELLERYATAQGGPEKINAIRSLRLSGQIHVDDKTLRFNQIKRVPNRIRMAIEYPNFTISTFSNGEQVWRIIKDRPAVYQVTGKEAEETLLEGKITSPLWTERNTPGVLKQLPDQPLEGIMHHRVEYRPKTGGSSIYWIHPDTYVETMLEYEKPDGDITVFRFSDYRPVDSLSIPYHTDIVTSDGAQRAMVLQNAEFNIGVFDSYFDPPETTDVWPTSPN